MPKRFEMVGEIGWDIAEAHVSQFLKEANGDDLDVLMSTPGGYVSVGIGIFNLFRDYKMKFPKSQATLTIIGEASSMGSYNMVNKAFDLVAAYDNAYAMIHNPWGGAVGDYREMEKTAAVFRGLTDLMAAAYAAKMGITPQAAKKIMDEETWYFGEELKAAGLVDEIIPAPEGEKDKAAALAVGRLRVEAVKEKMRTDPNAKNDLLKVAAMLRLAPSGSAQNQSQQQQHPASGGENNKGGVRMDKDKLKNEHPAVYDEVEKAGEVKGVEGEKARVKSLLALKEKYKGKAASAIVGDIVDKAIAEGSTELQALTDINVALSNGNIQASLESPGAIGTGSQTTGSGEGAGNYESNWE